MTFSEFFSVRILTFSAGSGSVITVLDPSAEADDVTGLRIQARLRLSRDAALTVGPFVEAEGFFVEPKGTITLEHGSRFAATKPHDGHTHAPTRADFKGAEDTASVLSYGFYFPDNPSNEITRFSVDDNADAHHPSLAFHGQSYITSVSDPDIVSTNGEIQELQLALRSHLEIEATTHAPPARNWFTGHVDLVYYPSRVPGDRTAARHEAVAADCCNVFFTDVNEPRCLKYWRSLYAKPSGCGIEHVFIDLVDERENYPPSPAREAFYIRDRAAIGESETGTPCGNLDRFAELRLNNLRFYYGVLYPADGTTVCGGEHYPLIKTIYGDFDGDCDVDRDDYETLEFYAKSSGPGIPSEYPLADFDGDCDIDLQDMNAFRVRLGRTCTCDDCGPSGCFFAEECPALNCPPGVGPVALREMQNFGSQSDQTEDNPAFVASMLLAYLAGETLPPAPDLDGLPPEDAEALLNAHEEQVASAAVNFASVVGETIAWLNEHLSGDEKALLVEQFSSVGGPYGMPGAAELAQVAIDTLAD